MAMLLTLRTASKNAPRILNAKYSLIGRKLPHMVTGVKRIPSVPAGTPIAIMKSPLMNVISRLLPNLGNKHRD